MGGTHSRFWGRVTGEETFGGILAEMIATTLNVNQVSGAHISILIEKTVIQRMRQIFHLPQTDGGVGVVLLLVEHH